MDLTVFTLTLKRLKLNLLSLRAYYIIILTIALTVLSAVVTTESLKTRREYLQARNSEWEMRLESAQAYARIYGQVVLIPSELCLISEGVGERLGVIARISASSGKLSVSGRSQANSLLALLPIDLAHIIGLMFSLMALLSTYDAIAGERELGTLRLVLAHNVPRSRLVMGEYIGAMTSLLIPLTGAWLIWLLLVRRMGIVGLVDEHWQRLGMFLVAAILLISVYVLVGLLVSSLWRQASTALIVTLFIWVMTTSLYPSITAWAATQLRPISSADPGEIVDVTQETTLNALVAQARLSGTLQMASPLSVFHAVAARMAGTDLNTYLRFLNHSKQYREEVRQWYQAKVARDPSRGRQWSSSFAALDITGFPQPQLNPEPMKQSLSLALPLFSLLLLMNAGLFVMTLMAINRYDPR